MDSISPDEFSQQVHDCLSHLYDYAYLQDHPLVQRCTPDTTGANRVRIFREIMGEAIECLRPAEEVSFHSRQARSYNILVLRYLDQQRTQDVIQQLALSERQFYREHPKAIQTLSNILWQRLTGTNIDDSDAAASMDISVKSEVQRVFSQAEQMQTDLETLLNGAIEATQRLAAQHHITVELRVDDELPTLEVYRSVFRQAIILILSQLIIQPAPVERLIVACEVVERWCRIIFRLEGQAIDLGSLQIHLEGQQTLRYLVDTIEGKLIYGPSHLILEVPLGQQTILVIDDNPGMVDLFHRYLTDKSYHLLVAHEGEDAVQLARKSRPSIIILDIMLPGQDGWEVLQSLKTHPTTREIPVLVCSVLDARDLALSLGANGFLQKPPGQADFLNALVQWRA